MGQLGIRSVLDCDMSQDLKRDIESQEKEYDSIETEVDRIAQKHQWTLSEINPAIRFMTERAAKLQLSYGNHDSKIAEMMIRSNTSGIIKNLRACHQAEKVDKEIQKISQKLIDTENANIQQMKLYL